MNVGIYSLQGTLFEGAATLINCKTFRGEITILDHHRPLISVLKQGIVKIIDKDKKEHFLPVSSGFLEATAENKVKLIVEE